MPITTMREALTLHKYGGLATWKELFFYQRHCNDPKQLQEIAEWARRKVKRGEDITLPLSDYIKQQSPEDIFTH